MVDERNSADLAGLLSRYARRAEDDLARWLVPAGTPRTLAEAMRYCVMDGGKRLRPAIVWMAAEAVAGDEAGLAAEDLTARAAVAVELVHSYSLVHDDLPAMDDDTLRRGRPTAHVQFGEAMAILAGDALLTRAFDVLCEGPSAPRTAVELVRTLAAGCGAAGMIAGQVADMDLCDVPDGREGMRFIHLRKTAALIRASAVMGGLCGGAEADRMTGLADWGRMLGLAFQFVDDLLDVTGSAQQLGKTPGKDAGAGKRTAVAELGHADAVRQIDELTGQAVAALTPLGPGADGLKELTGLLVRRTH